MALMAQIGVASVHLNGARAQFAATMIFTASTILVIGLIAAHEGPVPGRSPSRPIQSQIFSILCRAPDACESADVGRVGAGEVGAPAEFPLFGGTFEVS
jgi:hypothetical protein